MRGDLDNNGLVDLDDATLLRTILLNSTGQSFGLMTAVPEGPTSGLAVISVIGIVSITARWRPKGCRTGALTTRT
jgi:hypothetical protein